MINFADPARAAHSFVPAAEQWRMFAERRLLGAVLLRAIDDIRQGESEPLIGVACGCPADVPCAGNQCPHPITYTVTPALQWVVAMSEREWGFSWVCRKLGRDPATTMLAILGPETVERFRSLSGTAQGVILERGR
jgi:hypothetical protein